MPTPMRAGCLAGLTRRTTPPTVLVLMPLALMPLTLMALTLRALTRLLRVPMPLTPGRPGRTSPSRGELTMSLAGPGRLDTGTGRRLGRHRPRGPLAVVGPELARRQSRAGAEFPGVGR